MCDLFGDNDYRLVVGTTHKKLKVYRGTMMAAENQLVDVPSGKELQFADRAAPPLRFAAVSFR